METVNCIVCGADDKTTISSKGRWGLIVKTVACGQCGLVFNSPRMDEEEYRLFNEHFYRILYKGNTDPEPTYVDGQLNRMKKVEKYLHGAGVDLNSVTSVLDIGCSSGGTLGHFKKRGVARLQGIEPNIKFAQFARDHFGVNVFTGILEDWESDQTFDLVIMRDVLEHFRNPHDAMKIIREHCHEGSLVFIETNNIYKTLYPADPFHFNFQYAHPYVFSPNSLSNLLEISGFEMTNLVNERYMKCIARAKKSVQNDIVLKKDNVDDILAHMKRHDRLLPFKNIARNARQTVKTIIKGRINI